MDDEDEDWSFESKRQGYSNRHNNLVDALRHWFNFDHLERDEGLALVVGVAPYLSCIETLREYGVEKDIHDADSRAGIVTLEGVPIEVAPKGTSAIDNRERRRSIDHLNPFINKFLQLRAYWDSGNHPDVTSLSYFVEWAESKGFSPDWASTAEKMGLIPPLGQDHDEASSPPDRAHVSDKLAALNQAAFRFWAGKDRDAHASHPNNDEVAAWLKAKGFSSALARSSATIIRPSWAAKGRRPDE